MRHWNIALRSFVVTYIGCGLYGLPLTHVALYVGLRYGACVVPLLRLICHPLFHVVPGYVWTGSYLVVGLRLRSARSPHLPCWLVDPIWLPVLPTLVGWLHLLHGWLPLRLDIAGAFGLVY